MNQVLIEIFPRDLSFIAEDSLETIFGSFARYRLKINLMQNSAVSFKVVVNDDTSRLNPVIADLQKVFDVEVLKGLELITIRYYDDATIERVMKNKVKQYRSKAIIVAAPLTNVNLANWAAEESMIDILTLVPPYNEHKLRKTTARLAASNFTMLEVPINPLLSVEGMARARILKTFRESVATAIGSGMSIILSSGATNPLGMRSPKAMQHIGQMLGIEISKTRSCVNENVSQIINRNKQKLSDEYIANGIRIVKEGKDR